MKQTKPLKNQTQREAFIAKAKELGDLTEAAFDAVLKRIGKASVPAKKRAKKPAK